MKTLKWDQGVETYRHRGFTQDTGVEVFFTRPHSPQKRNQRECGSSELSVGDRVLVGGCG